MNPQWDRSVICKHPSSSLGQTKCHSENLEETTVSIRNSFPQKEPVSYIQKNLDLLIIILRSVLDHFSLVDDPHTSQFLILSHFFQYYFKNHFNFLIIPSTSNYKTTLSKYFSSLVQFHEVFDFQISGNIHPRIPISCFKDLALSTKKMDEYIGTLLPADSTFFVSLDPRHCKQHNQPLKFQLELQKHSWLI